MQDMGSNKAYKSNTITLTYIDLGAWNISTILKIKPIKRAKEVPKED